MLDRITLILGLLFLLWCGTQASLGDAGAAQGATDWFAAQKASIDLPGSGDGLGSSVMAVLEDAHDWFLGQADRAGREGLKSR